MSRRDALAALSALGALAMTGPLAAAPRRAPFAQALDAELRAIVEDPAAPLASLATLAVRDGRVVYEGHFGRRFIDPKGRAGDRRADAATLYRVASISKLIVTLAVLRLVDAGRVDLDADAGSYLGYPLRNPHFPGARVTLRQMLCHTSSLRDEGGYYFDEDVDLREVLTPGGAHYGTGGAWSARAAPGEFFHYTNFSWGVVGTVLEKVSGERFDRLMKRLVLDPLGMQGGFSPADLPPAKVGRIATLYRKRPPIDDAPWDPAGPWIPQVDDYSTGDPVPRTGARYEPGRNGTRYGPQGGLRASAGDLGRVMRMLIAGGVLDGKRFLELPTVDEMLREQWRRTGPRSGAADDGAQLERFQAWGLGNQHFTDTGGPSSGDRLVEGGGYTAKGHLGDAWGLLAAFAFNRERRDGMLFLCGGTGFDPRTQRGEYSASYRFEERILTAIHRHALNPKPRAPAA